MAVISQKIRGKFQLGKVPGGGVQEKEKLGYKVRFEQALMLSLVVMILIFGLSRRMSQFRKKWPVGPYTITNVDIIPLTRHGGMPRRPDLPQVPIPSEDEYLPEDETIETTELDLTEGLPFFDGIGDGVPGGISRGSGPRPIREVIPEYPKEERRRGVEGVVELSILVNSQGGVDSVRVVLNTTNSKRLEQSAIRAAYRSRYVPAQREGRKVSRWIRRPYRFEKK